MRNRFQVQDEEQWANETGPYAHQTQRQTPHYIYIDPHTAQGTGVHDLDDTHSTFIDTETPQGPPQDLP